ncbi:DUF1428 domain-containing protein [Comamonas odontotermitis]|uniref:Uncharacterized protein YbaA (DUF1428 family) n=1 Tax=Comamonas odontotermitis TaxID=379895 RepID=A0ABR6RGK8_9BURK|nr:DUF1428 domain-containing protein [Comamonas odontotermitis]MBB6578296.1 uncharacterized protein YbaA (DUF1428 family) [Comamonas odontotermitis]
MPYVDGFVLPVPRANLDAYRALAEKAGRVWLEHGALQYWECVGDDVPPGEITSFAKAVLLKDDEVACFSWIVYTSRAERDRINAAVMADPRLAEVTPENMPFDAKRMFFGGFAPIVQMDAPR